MNNVPELPKIASNDNKSLISKLIKYLSERNTQELLYLVLKIIVLVVIILLFKFPFDLIKDMGTNILTLFGIGLTDQILNIWGAIINIIYCLIGIIVFVKVIKERLLKI